MTDRNRLRHVELPVVGMTCAACAARVERVLNRLPGVEAAVSLATERASVSFDPAQTPAPALADAIVGAGYEVPRTRITLGLRGMTCAACASRIERVLNTLDGVDTTVNLAAETATVTMSPGQVSVDEVIERIRDAGYDAYELATVSRDARLAREAEDQRIELREFVIGAVLAAPFLLQMIVMSTGGHHDLLPRALQWLLATPVQLWVGRRFYAGAWHALRGGGANMDVLVVLGTTMAYLFSTVVLVLGAADQHVYFEASAMVIVLVRLGKVLEHRARQRASGAVEQLLRLQPRTARVRRGSDTADVDVDTIAPDDIVIVRNHEFIPVDGLVIAGTSAVTESMLTGESVPVRKEPGDNVYAATRNEDGTLEVRATGVGRATRLARIARLVEEAQGSKAPIQRLADRVAGVFVPAVATVAAFTFLGWWLVGGDATTGMINAVAVLVIACPCALGLATPAAVMVGTGRGAQLGILVRNAAALEIAERVSVLAFDKTGTLTSGKPTVDRVHALSPHQGSDVLAFAGALERGAQHPVASAILAAASAAEADLAEAADVRVTPGRGVEGRVGERNVVVGSARFLEGHGIATDAALAADVASRGSTAVLVAVDGAMAGCLEISDTLRDTARPAIARLRTLGVEPRLLSGDNAAAVGRIAAELGITDAAGDLQPEDKAAAVEALRRQGKVVGMAGDGVNDAPALAVADMSIALGSGTDIAVETSDITLGRDDLGACATAIELSRATMRKIRQNLFFAFVYNVLGIPLAVFGLLNPVVAGAAMAMSSVCVVTNALMLRRWQPASDPVSASVRSRSKTP